MCYKQPRSQDIFIRQANDGLFVFDFFYDIRSTHYALRITDVIMISLIGKTVLKMAESVGRLRSCKRKN